MNSPWSPCFYLHANVTIIPPFDVLSSCFFTQSILLKDLHMLQQQKKLFAFNVISVNEMKSMASLSYIGG
jgi:hypothetical protein